MTYQPGLKEHARLRTLLPMDMHACSTLCLPASHIKADVCLHDFYLWVRTPLCCEFGLYTLPLESTTYFFHPPSLQTRLIQYDSHPNIQHRSKLQTHQALRSPQARRRQESTRSEHQSHRTKPHGFTTDQAPRRDHRAGIHACYRRTGCTYQVLQKLFWFFIHNQEDVTP